MNCEMKFSRQDAQKAQTGNSSFVLQSLRIAHVCEDSKTDGHAVINAKAQRRSRFGIGIPSLRLCSTIPENCAFLAKFSVSFFRMTNDKFSMTNSQFRLGVLVAACRAAPFAPLSGYSLLPVCCLCNRLLRTSRHGKELVSCGCHNASDLDDGCRLQAAAPPIQMACGNLYQSRLIQVNQG